MHQKTTESDSLYQNIDQMSVNEILNGINNEDKKVALAVEKALPQIEALVLKVVENMQLGGRLFYLGAGTSGRLGIVDASECPPTFGVSHDLVIGIIAGGDQAIRKAVEFAEDDTEQGYKDLEKFDINPIDSVIGISASGSTPYVLGALKKCKNRGITTGSLCCNQNSEISKWVDFPIEVVPGPEFISGSTRMKSGTAQKMVLNMISTAVMVKLGRVKGNKMVDMQLSNAKLIERGTQMLMNLKNLSYDDAKKLLLEKGNVRKALEG